MGDLDADDGVAVGDGEFRRGLGIHVGDILFLGVTGHAGAPDIQEGQHASARAIDDGLLEMREVASSRRAGVDHGRDSHTQGEGIGEDACVAARQAHSVRSGKDVGMEIDQARDEVEPGDVDRFTRLFGRNIARNRRDQAIPDRYVLHGVALVLGVDDLGAL